MNPATTAAPAWKYPLGTVVLLVTALSYGYVNQITSGAQPLPLTGIDEWMPLLPWTIWIYFSYFFIFIVSFWMENNARQIKAYLISVLVINVVSQMIFLSFPTTYPRTFDITEYTDSTWTLGAFHWLHDIDRPVSCFPSLHVSASYLAAFLWRGRSQQKYWFFLIWAHAISLSTMTTKQHYLIDLIAGAGLAALIYAIVIRQVRD